MKVHYENIIIGSTLPALIYAYFNDWKIVTANDRRPYFFSRYKHGFDFGFCGLESEDRVLLSPQGEIAVGMKKLKSWNRLNYFLNLAGNFITPGLARGVRLTDDGELRAVSEGNQMIKLTFDRLHIFDPGSITGLPITPDFTFYEVIDWIDIKELERNELNYFYSGDSFLANVHLYFPDSVKVGRAQNIKYSVCTSYIHKDEIDEIGYSEKYACFKLEHIFKSAGMKGPKNGFKRGKQIYRPIKLLHRTREKNKILDLPYGENNGKIIYYPDCSEQAIFNNISKKAPRLWRLTRNLHLTPARRRA